MKSNIKIHIRDVGLAQSNSPASPKLQRQKNRSMSIQQMISRFSFCLLAWSTLAVAPALAQTITHEPLLIFNSDSTNDGFGRSVSGAGDVNGDGFADLIVGAASAAVGGSAEVLSGIDGSVLYNFNGDSFGDQFGTSVSGAGDVNGDGFADLIVGASQDDEGSARVFSGVDGSVLYNFDGDSFIDQFGFSVSGAGDVNGDGVADLIVGARLDDNNGSNSGSARVFSGTDGSVLYTFDGDSAGDFFGQSVSGAGDVNGDGFDDLIVGAPLDSIDPIDVTDSGSARVLSGADGSVLYTFNGDSALDAFGNSVSGAGDVNGDGFDDLIVGAPTDSTNGTDSGSATVLSGADGSVLYKFVGDSAFQLFGLSVSGAGDVNGDGADDLIVGTRNTTARVFSGADGSVIYDIDSRGFGASVSGAGDVNGDSVADFIVGGSTTQEARVYVSQIIILGDCNQDSVVNFLDITPFIGILSSGSFLEEADVNRDGSVSFLDITPFIGILAGN